MRSLSIEPAVLLLSLILITCGCDRASARIERRTVEGTSRAYWIQQDFVEMVPAIRPPTTADETDLIEVWIALPLEPIGVESDRTGRPLPILPAGARLDRIELGVSKGGDVQVIDVRGTEVGGQAEQRFHVFEPLGGGLVGVAWARGEKLAQAEADSAYRKTLSDAHETPDDIERLVGLNRCDVCHVFRKPTSLSAGAAGLPNRPTDASGFYGILAVLTDESVLESSRPRETNTSDPFITFHCAAPDDGRAAERREPEKETGRSGEPLRCADGSPVRATLDVARAVAANDPHAKRVCGSRRYLFEHMSADARRAFETAFRDCGIETETPKRVSEGTLK